VGLPLALEMVRSGRQVVGLDSNEAVVERLAMGRSHVDDVSDGMLAERLGRFRPTTDREVISDADTVVVCVPTPLSREGLPDLGAVEDAGRMLGKWLSPGTLV